jgi:hypothetical protein
MRVDFPTFGIPQIISQSPTVANLVLFIVVLSFNTSERLSRFYAETAMHLMPTDWYFLIIWSVTALSQRSYLLNSIIFSF